MRDSDERFHLSSLIFHMKLLSGLRFRRGCYKAAKRSQIQLVKFARLFFFFGALRRFQIHGYFAEARVVQEQAEGFFSDQAAADMGVTVDARAQRLQAVIEVDGPHELSAYHL